MALIKCGECGKEISDKAASCPGCGAPSVPGRAVPVNVTRAGGKWEGWGFSLIVGGMLTAMVAEPPVSSVGGVAMLAGFAVFIIGRFK